MHGEIDAEALFRPVDEFLAERDAVFGEGEALAITHDWRHGEDAEGISAHFNADDRLAGLVGFHHGRAPRRDVVAERLGIVHT
jgi:hypothetical protein